VDDSVGAAQVADAALDVVDVDRLRRSRLVLDLDEQRDGNRAWHARRLDAPPAAVRAVPLQPSLLTAALATTALAAGHRTIDGVELQWRTNVVALRITTEGVKIPLELWEGSTENGTVATALLSDLVERGLDPEQGIGRDQA
jgi:hypothetical protein